MTSIAEPGVGTANPRELRPAACGERFASRSGVPVTLVVARSLAVMCHPLLAWRRLPPRGRVALAGAYAGFSYLTALLTLLALQR